MMSTGARANSTAPNAIEWSAASTLRLPPGSWTTVFACLCDHFAKITPAQWRDRFLRGRVLDEHGVALAIAHPYRRGLCVRYFREVAAEPIVPFEETLIHVDEHLVVVDKPHFLAVMPAGRHVAETLLARLVKRLGNRDLVPLHRIDRSTAGLVMLSANPASRAAYQALFRQRAIAKRYEALAPALPDESFPLSRKTRIVAAETFFLMREADGIANSETRIEILTRDSATWRYALFPHTGRKHQLRVHMAALGAPILNDTFYPDLVDEHDDDTSRPLKLLAQGLSFDDPLDGRPRHFESCLKL